MKRPPEPPEFRTEAQVIEDAIVKACRTIREHWDDMLPTAPAPVRFGVGRSAGILGDTSSPDGINSKGKPYWIIDGSKSDNDVDGSTRLVSLRRKTTTDLNGWCRVVVEERRDIDNERSVTSGIPDGFDVPGMCRFLTLHADWFAGHEAALDALVELKDDARDVKAVVDAYRKEWHKIGPCPLTVNDLPCEGIVQIRVAAEDDVASCTVCGKGERVHWWQDAMGKAKREFALAPEMSRILHDRLHVTASPRTVRRWALEGRVPSWFRTPLGPWPDGHPPEGPRHWFEVDVALHEVALMDRVCPMCGGLWSGEGQVCLRCYSASKDARATYGDDRSAYAVGTADAPAPDSPDVCSLDERARCTYSDLPTRWCGCGRHARVSA